MNADRKQNRSELSAFIGVHLCSNDRWIRLRLCRVRWVGADSRLDGDL